MTVHADGLPDFDSRWAMFLDFDGTLAELAEEPHLVEVDAAVPGALMRINEALDGALAVISGRSIAELDAFLAPLVLTTAGLHGLEWRDPNGTVHESPAANGAIGAVRQALADFAATASGVRLEDKGPTIALHYRQAPDAEAACRQAVAAALAGHGRNLGLLEGKMVLEVKPKGIDKGRAIARFMSEPPFRSRIPFFAGDDVTDEDGFKVVNRGGGISIRVGDGRTSRAQLRTDSVPAFLDWLHALPGESVTIAAPGR